MAHFDNGDVYPHEGGHNCPTISFCAEAEAGRVIYDPQRDVVTIELAGYEPIALKVEAACAVSDALAALIEQTGVKLRWE